MKKLMEVFDIIKVGTCRHLNISVDSNMVDRLLHY